MTTQELIANFPRVFSIVNGKNLTEEQAREIAKSYDPDFEAGLFGVTRIPSTQGLRARMKRDAAPAQSVADFVTQMAKPPAAFAGDTISLQPFQVEDETQVREYISHHPGVAPVLKEAGERIRQFFPEATLELKVEPNFGDAGYTELLLSICTNLPGKEARETMQRFRDSWWRQASKEVWGKFFIMTELR